MGANVNDVYKFVQFIANKSQDGGNISPSEFNRAAEFAQRQWGKDVYNNPKQYSPGRPVPVVGYEASQKVSDDLRVLKVVAEIIPDSQGYVPLPDNYWHASSLRYRYKLMVNGNPSFKETDVAHVNDGALGGRLSGDIVAPTKRYPIYTDYEDKLRVWPHDAEKVIFTYLRDFISPVWAYTLENGLPVYDESNSTNFDVEDSESENIVMRICSYLGIVMREQMLAQYAETLKAQD